MKVFFYIYIIIAYYNYYSLFSSTQAVRLNFVVCTGNDNNGIFILSSGKEHQGQGETLKRLIVASNIILPTSAECERGFSACNDTDRKTRNRLQARSLTALLFVDLNGPPIDKFDPLPYIQSWIKKGHRTSTSWVPGPRPKPPENRALWSIFSA